MAVNDSLHAPHGGGGGGGDAAAHEHASSPSPRAAAAAAAASPLLPGEVEQALLPKPHAPAAAAYRHPFSTWRRRYMVLLVSAMTAMLCADQNLLAPNLSAAAAFFNLDERQKDTFLGGYLMAAFFLVGAPAALLCGYLADRFNRVWMLFTIVIVGEAPCLCTYWVTTLWQFFLVRMLTGIAVGGCFPLVFSLLGDLFPVSQRSAMAALVQISVGAGIGGGQMLAGIVGPATNWRVPFVVMAAPSLALAVLLVTTTQEPPRGGFEEALASQLAAGEAYSETISAAKLRRLLRVPSNWIIILQGIPGCLPWGVMQTYLVDYLHLQQGFSVEVATVIILVFGIGCGVGVLAGGAAGQWLYNRRKESMAVLTGLAVLAGAGPVYFLVNAHLASLSFALSLFMAALAGFLVSIAGPNLRAVMLNVNTPETRGVSLALQSVTDDLGRGLGPIIVAAFISQLGRQAAFNVAVAGWIPCGLLLLCLVFTMRKDEAAMQRQLAEMAGRDGSSSGSGLQQVRVLGAVEGLQLSTSSTSSSGGGLGGSSAGKAGGAGTALAPLPPGWGPSSLGGSGSGGSRGGTPRHRQQQQAGSSLDGVAAGTQLAVCSGSGGAGCTVRVSRLSAGTHAAAAEPPGRSSGEWTGRDDASSCSSRTQLLELVSSRPAVASSDVGLLQLLPGLVGSASGSGVRRHHQQQQRGGSAGRSSDADVAAEQSEARGLGGDEAGCYLSSHAWQGGGAHHRRCTSAGSGSSRLPGVLLQQ